MFTGTGTALVTPFRRDGSLDEPALRALIKRQIEAGVDFLVPCGTTGESPTLTHEEHLRVVKITVELARDKVPVLGGAGGYNTAEVIALSQELAALGANGILSVTPYYNKPTQEGLFQHYRAIAEAVPLPIILYSVQGRTGVNIEPGTVKRLAEIENIVGIKEASGNVSQMAAILNAVPEGFIVLSGDDAITLPVISLGGRGVISVVSNEVPAEMSQLTRLALQGDFPAARAIHRRYHPLMEINFVESNPIPVKAAMAEMGLLEPVWRLPLVPPKAENQARIRAVLEALGLVGRSAADPARAFAASDGVRIVPGGSSIRDGSYIGRGVICMPPMFVNVGAYIGEGSMIDSHALVGSCAQVGRNCHISAGSQIGGVLEPVGTLPVIIEDEVLVGGNSGVYEGTVVKRRAVLGTGTILNRSIPVYDLVRDAIYTATETEPLLIPEEAIVVPGSRAVAHPSGAKWGLSLQAAVIVKYRDSKTEGRIQLEDLLR